MPDNIISFGAIAISILLPTLGWLLADARSKAKMIYLEANADSIRDAFDKHRADSDMKINTLEVKLARSEQDRQEIHRVIDKMDAQKASKEVVDGFRSEMISIKSDMDKRFDKLERLLEPIMVKNNS